MPLTALSPALRRTVLGIVAVVATLTSGLVALSLGGGPAERAIDQVIELPWQSADPLVRATWGGVAVLGDSFSSGEGAGDYGVPATTRSCHVSAAGYGIGLVDQLGLDRTRLTIRACTGARLSSIGGRYDDHDQDPQLDGIDPSTSLVTMTIGGNDVDWSRVLADCITKVYLPGTVDCRDGTELDRSLEARIDAVGPRLAGVLEQVRSRAPYARVVVMGYPRFFPAEPHRTFTINRIPAFGIESQRWANEQTDRLNRVIASAAAEAGAEYVDAGRAFAGHELTTEAPWFHGVDLDLHYRGFDGMRPKLIDVDSSTFHPTAEGQRALSALIEAQVRHPVQ